MSVAIKYTLSTEDNCQIVLSQSAASQCGVINAFLQSCPSADFNTSTPVHKNIKGKTLKKVCEWLKHYEENPPVYNEDDRDPSNLPDWDKKFFEVSSNELFEILFAANFMDIKVLHGNTCKAIANLINGKSREQLHDICFAKRKEADGDN